MPTLSLDMRRYLHPKYWAVAFLSIAQFLLFLLLTDAVDAGIGGSSRTEALSLGIGMLAFGLVGAVILIKAPGNRIGWVFAVVGIVAPLASFQQIAVGLLDSGVDVRMVAVGQMLADMAFQTFFICVIVLTPLWFPTGRAINRYFAVAAPLALVGFILSFLFTLGNPTTRILVDDTLQGDDAWLTLANPLAHWPLPYTSAFEAGFVFGLLAAFVAVASMIVRVVKSRGTERLQMKWLLFTEALLVGYILLTIPFEAQLEAQSTGWQLVQSLIPALLILAVPISVGIAITKHRLYDIDVVISKTITYGALGLFITGVYALVVVGVGTLIGTGDEQNLALSITAVAIVAVAFEPLRHRLQRWANRLVFGHRASPYEVLSMATTRLAGTGSPEEALEQVTQLVADGTGAADAVLWLKVGETLQPNAATPSAALVGLVGVLMSSNHLPELPAEISVPVRHRGEILGALSISKPQGDFVTSVDERMLNDVASGIGLLLRNISLNAELAERAQQLRISRRRLVATHDAERHRLERDLHDGAQQQVVAIKVKLGIAGTLAEREHVSEVESVVASLAAATQEAVDSMRAVAHGIYPPLLEAEGLGVALTAARRAFAVRVDLEVDGIGRYERSVEESLYFCSVETVTRAIDGGATWASIEIGGSADSVQFTVRHNGDVGDLVSVADRVEAFGGQLHLGGGAAEGVVTGHVPSIDTLAVTV